MKILFVILQLLLIEQISNAQFAGVDLNRQVLEGWNFYLNSVDININFRQICQLISTHSDGLL